MPGRLVFSTTKDSQSSPTEAMRIDSSQRVLIGATASNSFFTTGGSVIRLAGATINNQLFTVDSYTGVPTFSVFYNSNTVAPNAANSTVKIGQMGATARSINATGTINASGADYAEYMTKAGDFTLQKGDICGITRDGTLTNKFADAVGFAVKSTNPSYVGGDTWGSEDLVGKKPSEDEPSLLEKWEENFEIERQKVDRIAFAGQVPVNVAGATPGQYIIPIETNGFISGLAKDESDLTLTEYMRAVGKVIAIEDDGRARIIVKVA
jgi:hypothetical protein